MIKFERSTQGIEKDVFMTGTSVIYHFFQLEISNGDLKNRLQKAIDIYNDEIDYPGMWDMQECKSRLEKGDVLFLLYDNDWPGTDIIGWAWINKYDGLIHNTYIRKDKRNGFLMKKFTLFTFSVIIRHGSKKLYGFVDEWNKNSLWLYLSCGFTITENPNNIVLDDIPVR